MLQDRYQNPVINRQFWLSQAMIHVKPTVWARIDEVAAECTDAEIEAFCKIVAKLNGKPIIND